MMTDEGCQTVGLEDGDAAEVFAAFHKQVMNAGSSSYKDANGTIASEAQTQTQREAASELHEIPADLPMIQTQLDPDVAKLQDHESHVQNTPQNMLSSPRLQPISSDALPLVSPLITKKYDAFIRMVPPERIVGHIPSVNEQVTPPIEESALPTAEEEQEDLYGASPAAIHGQARMSEFDGFQDPSVGFNALEEASNMRDQFLSEDQYGHWQAANAHLSRGGSPHKSVGETGEEEKQDGFYVERQQEEIGFPNNGFPIPASDEPHPHQYPDPEEAKYGQRVGTSWGSVPKATAYPTLPEPDQGLENGPVAQQTLHGGPVAMSRSESAQSAAIDLTESGDEEGAEGEYEDDIPLEHPIDKEDYERSSISEEAIEHAGEPKEDPPRQQLRRVRLDGYRSLGEETSDEDEEEGSLQDQLTHDSHLPYNSHLDDEDASQGSQDEGGLDTEEIYEEEFVEDEEQHQGYPTGFDLEQEEDFDEEDEGGYDEDMEDYDQPNRHPVVIDLLSSDDEDEGGAVQPKLEPETIFRHPLEAEEEEQCGSDEDMGAEQDLSAGSRNRALQQLAGEQPEDEDENERFAVEEDENIVNADEDEDFPGTGDEASMKDDASNDGSLDNEPTEFQKETEMAQPDDSPEDEEAFEAPEAIEEVTVESGNEDEKSLESPEELQQAIVEPTKPGEEIQLERLALQELQGNCEIPRPEGKDEECRPSDVEATSEQPRANLPPPPPTLFAQMFNLDGANDERQPSLYPVLPTEKDAIPTSEALLSETNSQPDVSVSDQHLRHANGQLPTPDATQISLVKESSDVSLSSVKGQVLSLAPLQTTSDELTSDIALENAPQRMEEDNVTSAYDTTVNIETETTGTEAVDEEIAQITLEVTKPAKTPGEKVTEAVIEAHNTRSRTRLQNGRPEPVIREELQVVEEVARVNPRRSHRRGRSTSSVPEPPQTKASTTPSKSATKARQDEPISARTDRSPSIILDERATPKGHDASIELAMSALDSPVKQHYALRSKQPSGDVKFKLTRALRTELSEFTSLKVLRFHMTQKLDILGIATTIPAEPERAKGGPRHYQITFNITDQSIAPGGSPPVTEVQVFRPYKDALPIVKVGDGILLRNFLVISVKNRGFALQSTDASSWAVFSGDEEEKVEVRGPPVEYGAGEQKHISMLRSWYSELEPAAMQKIIKANGDKSTGKGIGKVF